MAYVFAERLGVDDADHLAHQPCGLAIDRQLRVKARVWSRLRCRADDDRRELKEIVRLDDHSEAAAVLCVTSTAWQCDGVNVTADHGGAP